MLADALAAEFQRARRDRGTMFWAFAFPAVLTFVGAVLTSLFVRFVVRKDMGAPVDLARELVAALGGGGSPFVQLFFILGAAALFGADYRWETWRLQTPRNSRTNLMLSRFAVFGAASLTGLLLMGFAGILGALAGAAIEQTASVSASFSNHLAEAGRALLGSWLEMMVVGAMAALLAVLTRSSMAAVITALVIVIGQSILISVLRLDPVHPPMDAIASLPNLAGQVVRGGVVGPGGATAQGAGPAGLFLILWAIGLGASTILWFRRQPLSRE